MMQLNYHHLYYFYITAREGSIHNASKVLNLTPQTVSSQLGTFEDYLGMRLFDRNGRRLVLNERGQLVYSFAEDIFGLGNELLQNLKYQQVGQQVTFVIGVTDVIPKVLAFDLFRSCIDHQSDIKLVCKEGGLEDLLADLAISKLDIIFSDRPVTPGSNVKVYNHRLGESGFTFFAAEKLQKELQGEFPKNLEQQPVLIPGDKSTQKISLLTWFENVNVRPNIVAEFEDTALMKLFGQAGYGIFGVPTIIEEHVKEQFEVEVVGRTNNIKEPFYLISPERKIKHPAAKPLFDFAKNLFETA